MTMPSVSICLGDSIYPFNQTSGAVAYHWQFGDSDTDTVATPVHLYAGTGSYTITLTATDTLGCEDSVSQFIEVHPRPEPGWARRTVRGSSSGAGQRVH